MPAETIEDGSPHRGSSFAKAAVQVLNNDRLCYINVDDNPDPLFELGRLLPLQLAWSFRGKRAPIVADGKFEEAMTLADKLVRWEPRTVRAVVHGERQLWVSSKPVRLEADCVGCGRNRVAARGRCGRRLLDRSVRQHD